jgi:3D (Asp-Asp-Asp) domain-containing protein
MTRLAFAALLLVGCAAPAEIPGASSAAPGVKRYEPAVSTALGRREHGRRRPSTSRSLHRRPVPIRLLQITGYCYTGSRNAAGNWPTVGTAAANAYPLGTRLHVESYGTVTVEDRSAVGSTDVDLYLGSDSGCQSRAIAWGRRLLHVTESR